MGAVAINQEKEFKNIWSVFCSFLLKDMEVALPVEMIQEVVNYPEAITKMPLTPPYLEGVFNLRGMIIPIANMHTLLKSGGEISSSAKVVIVNFKGIKLGLIFDSTSEILKVTSENICRFDYTKGTKNIVSGALKLDGGKRILQVIEPEALSQLDQIPHIVDKIKITTGVQLEKNTLKNQKRKQCISFKTGDITMAFEMDAIHEIIKFQKLEEGFVNFDYTLGLLNLRGSLISIINLGQFLASGTATEEEFEHKKIVIIKSKNDRKLGLLVDSVEDIVAYYDNDLLSVSGAMMETHQFYQALLSKGDKEIILLNQQNLMGHTEIHQIVEGHARLFKEDENRQQVKKKIERQVFISFLIEGKLSLPIQDIREIVNYPDHFITPPGAKSYVTGIFNLRDKVVTVIDMRKFYGLPSLESNKDCKVVIVEKGSDSFGFVVDSIDEIFSVNVEEKFPVSDMLATKTEKLFTFDMKELVLVCDKKNDTQNKLIVLDLSKMLSRIGVQELKASGSEPS